MTWKERQIAAAVVLAPARPIAKAFARALLLVAGLGKDLPSAAIQILTAVVIIVVLVINIVAERVPVCIVVLLPPFAPSFSNHRRRSD